MELIYTVLNDNYQMYHINVKVLYLQYIYECYVLGDVRIAHYQFHILWTVYAHMVPEHQQGLKIQHIQKIELSQRRYT